MEYLGSLGRLVPLRCASAEGMSFGPRYSTRTTVEGVRRAQLVPAQPRTWDVTWDLAYTGDVAALSGFADGAWGAGPWHWVPIQAHQGNLLTPREASLVDFVPASYWAGAGPVMDAEGQLVPRSLAVSLASGWAAPWRDIPVLPGRRVTWAADVAGTDGPALAMAFFDAEGVQVAGFYGTSRAGAGARRVSMSATPPSLAASVRVGVQPAVSVLTRPQVTWTTGQVPFSRGHGCRSAVLDGFEESLLYAADQRRGAFTAHQFTVMEVA